MVSARLSLIQNRRTVFIEKGVLTFILYWEITPTIDFRLVFIIAFNGEMYLVFIQVISKLGAYNGQSS